MIKSRRVGLTGHAACMGEKKCAYKVSVGKHEGKRSLRRPRRRCEDNIKTNLKETG
jgi:hypothetical protein